MQRRMDRLPRGSAAVAYSDESGVRTRSDFCKRLPGANTPIGSGRGFLRIRTKAAYKNGGLIGHLNVVGKFGSNTSIGFPEDLVGIRTPAGIRIPQEPSGTTSPELWQFWDLRKRSGGKFSTNPFVLKKT
ncbi:hypothetical protein E4U61_005063 [Claviceps capensis]|nr:hypothetical protein E4U61_005063 [Claviceps capensis]